MPSAGVSLSHKVLSTSTPNVHMVSTTQPVDEAAYQVKRFSILKSSSHFMARFTKRVKWDHNPIEASSLADLRQWAN